MAHIVELCVLLLLLSVGHGVVDVAPELSRRIVRGFILWMLAMAGAAVVFSIPPLAIWAVRLGLVLVAVYTFQWILGGIVGFVRGPFLFAEPGTRVLAAAAHRASGLPMRECRRLARRMRRAYHGYTTLLGLAELEATEGTDAEAFGCAWSEECERALAGAREVVCRCAGKDEGDRVGAADILFVTQALCRYESKAVHRVLSGPGGGGSRRARVKAARKLEHVAAHRRTPEWLDGIFPEHASGATPLSKGFRLWMLFWPAGGIARAGFSERAIALAVSFSGLLLYGLLAVTLGRGAGWVYLAVAALIHIEAVFALSDFPVPSGVEGTK